MSVKRFFQFKKKKEPRTIVLGIHGLGNKPPQPLLKKWWKKSLLEGLAKIDGSPNNFNFYMVYWADIMYPKPLSPTIKDPKHELHIEEPYIPEPIPSPAIRSTKWHLFKLAIDKFKEVIFLSKNGLANYRIPFDFVVKQSFKDLAAYYNEDQTEEERLNQTPVKKQIRNRLRRVLYRNRKKRIIIIAHSMGSIISYDVLYMLQNIYEIETFVTAGSPLGLPLLRENIAKEHGLSYHDGAKLPTPSCIVKWYNMSDKEDHFAVYDQLSNYFTPNAKTASPNDLTVDNDYKDWVTDNAHKSFGYLRTEEMGQILTDFLNKKPHTLWQKTRRLFNKKRNK